MSPKERFESKIMPEPNTGCWIWTDFLTYKGYGYFWFNGKYKRAHRFSFELYKFKIPETLHVLHTCDNRFCVNPDHLIVGSNLDNMIDRNNKNRQAKGERCSKNKLTSYKVASIKNLIASGEPLKNIASLFDVSVRNINYIKNNKIWTHVHG